jgi:hypothetical protein
VPDVDEVACVTATVHNADDRAACAGRRVDLGDVPLEAR